MNPNEGLLSPKASRHITWDRASKPQANPPKGRPSFTRSRQNSLHPHQINDQEFPMFDVGQMQSKNETVVGGEKKIFLKNHKKWAKYLRDNEESLTEEELKKRKRQHFLNKLFYKKLCTLVDRIKQFQGTSDTQEQKAIEERKQRQDELRREKEYYKRKMREQAKEREAKQKLAQQAQAMAAQGQGSAQAQKSPFLSVLRKDVKSRPHGSSISQGDRPQGSAGDNSNKESQLNDRVETLVSSRKNPPKIMVQDTNSSNFQTPVPTVSKFAPPEAQQKPRITRHDSVRLSQQALKEVTELIKLKAGLPKDPPKKKAPRRSTTEVFDQDVLQKAHTAALASQFAKDGNDRKVTSVSNRRAEVVEQINENEDESDLSAEEVIGDTPFIKYNEDLPNPNIDLISIDGLDSSSSEISSPSEDLTSNSEAPKREKSDSSSQSSQSSKQESGDIETKSIRKKKSRAKKMKFLKSLCSHQNIKPVSRRPSVFLGTKPLPSPTKKNRKQDGDSAKRYDMREVPIFQMKGEASISKSVSSERPRELTTKELIDLKHKHKLDILKEKVFSHIETRELFMKDLRPSYANCQMLDFLSQRLTSLEKKYEPPVVDKPSRKAVSRSKSRGKGIKYKRGSQERVFAKINQLEAKIARQKSMKKKPSRPSQPSFSHKFSTIVESDTQPAALRMNSSTMRSDRSLFNFNSNLKSRFKQLDLSSLRNKSTTGIDSSIEHSDTTGRLNFSIINRPTAYDNNIGQRNDSGVRTAEEDNPRFKTNIVESSSFLVSDNQRFREYGKPFYSNENSLEDPPINVAISPTKMGIQSDPRSLRDHLTTFDHQVKIHPLRTVKNEKEEAPMFYFQPQFTNLAGATHPKPDRSVFSPINSNPTAGQSYSQSVVLNTASQKGYLRRKAYVPVLEQRHPTVYKKVSPKKRTSAHIRPQTATSIKVLVNNEVKQIRRRSKLGSSLLGDSQAWKQRRSKRLSTTAKLATYDSTNQEESLERTQETINLGELGSEQIQIFHNRPGFNPTRVMLPMHRPHSQTGVHNRMTNSSSTFQPDQLDQEYPQHRHRRLVSTLYKGQDDSPMGLPPFRNTSNRIEEYTQTLVISGDMSQNPSPFKKSETRPTTLIPSSLGMKETMDVSPLLP